MKKINVKLKDNGQIIRIQVKATNRISTKSEKADKKNSFYIILTVICSVAALVYIGLSIMGIKNNLAESSGDNILRILKSILYLLIPIGCGVTALFINRFKTSDKLAVLSLIIALASFIMNTADKL